MIAMTTTAQAYAAGREAARRGNGLYASGSQRCLRAFLLGVTREIRHAEFIATLAPVIPLYPKN